MEFCLLGPLLVRSGGAVVPMPSAKQRVVLATLLLNAGRVVPVHGIAESLWGPVPPRSARVGVQNHVMRLRRALGEPGGARIATQPPGYLIRVDPDELDLTRCEARLAAARAAIRDGSWHQATAHACEALMLWRGEPLADVDSEVLAMREIPRLAELRLQTLEVRIDADLHLGRHAEVITELRRLAGEHPLREQVHRQLMLALYRDGRQAEALAAYAGARRLLADELGAEPGAGLRQLQQQVLAADPALELAETERPARPLREPAVPRQLPPATPHFIGREREFAELTGLMDPAGRDRPGAVVISAIGGTAGVGKTALAVQWARQISGRFPDGHLYVDMRGYDPDQPVSAADALAGFLRALGVPGRDIPAQEAERAAQYRSLLAGRRVLVLLDNAAEPEQIRPLLPGSPACAVVVTSRDSLAGLVARDGARRLSLDMLPLEDAVVLLQALIGARAHDDPETAAILAERCCRLPLALRVAAELAVSRPDVPLAELADELADQKRRLDLLTAGGDRRTAVRAVFSWSCQHLTASAGRMFRLLSLHPGPDFDAYAAAALTSLDLKQARHLLDQLTRAHLIQPGGPCRYRMHDLLRAYARELACAHDTPGQHRDALTSLFGHYLYTAATAMNTLFPAENHRRPRVWVSATAVPAVAGDPVAAQHWLDAERATLLATAVHAATQAGWPDHAIKLAAIMFRYLQVGGYNIEAISMHACACRAARDSGDQAAEASALTSLGLAALHQGEHQPAADHLRQALALHRQTGDKAGQARALTNLGFLDHLEGREQQAIEHYGQTLALHRQLGDLFGQAQVLDNLGNVYERLGRYQESVSYHLRSLALHREIGSKNGEARALTNLGCVGLRQGNYEEATARLRRALELCRQTGSKIGQAHVLASLGEADLRQGRFQEAMGGLEQALAVFRESGDRSGECEALNGIGEVLLALGQPEQARTRYVAALRLARQIGVKYEQARACGGLARCHHADGDLSQARQQWREALALYTDLGAPETEQIRAQLGAAE